MITLLPIQRTTTRSPGLSWDNAPVSSKLAWTLSNRFVVQISIYGSFRISFLIAFTAPLTLI